MRSESVEVELQVPRHRLEVAGVDLHRQVVRNAKRQLGLGLARTLQVPPYGKVCEGRCLQRFRCTSFSIWNSRIRYP